MTSVEAILSREIVLEILIEDIVPTASALLTRLLMSGETDAVYARRPMSRSIFTVELLDAIPFKASTLSGASFSLPLGLIVSSFNGSICSLYPTFPIAALLCCFHECGVDKLSTVEVEIDVLLRHIEDSDMLRGAFSCLVRSCRAVGLIELFAHYSLDKKTIHWDNFRRLILLREPSTSPCKPSSFPDATTALLYRLFSLLSIDASETLPLHCVKRVFADMDGLAPKLLPFEKAALDVCGDLDEQTLVSFEEFLSLRVEYSSAAGILTGGLLVYGRLLMQSVNILENEQDVDTLLTVDHLIEVLPTAVLDATVLPAEVTVQSLLRQRHQINLRGLFTLIGLDALTSSGAFKSFSMSLSKKRALRLVFWGANDHFLYAVDSLGVLSKMNSLTFQEVCRQRIIYAEPSPSKAVESADKFHRWIRDFSAVKTAEDEKIGDVLSEFITSSSIAPNLLYIDSESGLIAVNNSINCGAITLLDASSLCRIYRILPPFKLSTSSRDAVANIFNGIAPDSPVDLFGAVSAMILLGCQGLLLCTVVNHPDTFILNITNGETMARLRGHSAPITALSLDPLKETFCSGSADGTIRMWRISDCVPKFDTSGLASEDKEVQFLTKRMVGLPGPTFGGIKYSSRDFRDKLLQRLNLFPYPIEGKVHSFFDNSEYFSDSLRTSQLGVELLLLDGSVISITDTTASILRNHTLTRSPLTAGEFIRFPLVSPSVAALTFARELGVPADARYSVEFILDRLHLLLPQLGLDILTGVLSTMNLEKNDTITFISLFRRLLLYSDSFSNFCENLLEGVHHAAIVGINFCPSSDTLITLDKLGTLCVWDLLAIRPSLSVKATGLSFEVFKPFRLISKRCLLLDPGTSAFALTSCMCKCSKGVHSFASTELLLRAAALDMKYSKVENKIHGFIYVYDNFSYEVIETGRFAPSMVYLSLSPTEISISGDMTSLSAILRKISTLKEQLLRIIYVVSASHFQMNDLISDLLVHGVLHKGHIILPSDLIDIVCFERPFLPSSAVNKSQRRQITSAGVIVSVNGDDVCVGVDYSNDLLLVPSKQLLTISATTGEIHLNYGSVTDLSSYVGFRATFLGGDSLSLSPPVGADVVFVQIAESNAGCESTLIPVSIGRTKFTTSADCHLIALKQSDFALANQSFIRYSAETLGWYCMEALLLTKIQLTRSSFEAGLNRRLLQKLQRQDPKKDRPLMPIEIVLALGSPLERFFDGARELHHINRLKLSPLHPWRKHVEAAFQLQDGHHTSGDGLLEAWLHCSAITTNECCAMSCFCGDMDAVQLQMALFGRGTSGVVQESDLRALFSHASNQRLASVPYKVDEILSECGALNSVLLQNVVERVLDSGAVTRFNDFMGTEQPLQSTFSIIKAVDKFGKTTAPYQPAEASLIKKHRDMTPLRLQSVEELPCPFSASSWQRLVVTSLTSNEEIYFLALRSDDLTSIMDAQKRVESLNLKAHCVEHVKDILIDGFDCSNCLIYSISKTMVPLSSIVFKDQKMFCKSKIVTIQRILASIFGIVYAFHQKSLTMFSLSPSTLFIDTDTCAVRVLLSLLRTNGGDTLGYDTLSDYIRSIQEVGGSLARSCIPPSWEIEVQNSAWDIYSLGATIFYFCFGFPYSHHSHLRSSSLATPSVILLVLLQKSRQSNDENLAPFFTEGIPLFDVAEHFSGEDMKSLKEFRSLFIQTGLEKGGNSASLGNVWENLIQSIFSKVSVFSDSLLEMKLKLDLFSPDFEDESSFAAYFLADYHLRLSDGDVRTLLSCFSLSTHGISFKSKMLKTMRQLSGLLGAIQVYGTLQVVLVILSNCLESDTNKRVPLETLSSFWIFHSFSCEDPTDTKLVGFSSAESYLESMVHSPLRECILSDEVAKKFLAGRISSALNEIEQVFFSMSSKCQRLTDTGASSAGRNVWLEAHCHEIIAAMENLGTLELIAASVMRCRKRNPELAQSLLARTLVFFNTSIELFTASAAGVCPRITFDPDPDGFKLRVALGVAVECWFSGLVGSLRSLYLGRHSPIAHNHTACSSDTEDVVNEFENFWEAKLHSSIEPLLILLCGESGCGSNKMTEETMALWDSQLNTAFLRW